MTQSTLQQRFEGCERRVADRQFRHDQFRRNNPKSLSSRQVRSDKHNNVSSFDRFHAGVAGSGPTQRRCTRRTAKLEGVSFMRLPRKWVLSLGLMAAAPGAVVAGPLDFLKPNAGQQSGAAGAPPSNQDVAEAVKVALERAKLTG